MPKNSPPVTPFVPWPDGLEIVLASRSPRRSELLRTAGLPFVCQPAGEVESKLATELLAAKTAPGLYVEKLAMAKALNVYEQDRSRLVLGADTVVVLDEQILEKPADPAEARYLLGRLSGRRHAVLTAIALVGGLAGTSGVVEHESTFVEFLPVEIGRASCRERV